MIETAFDVSVVIPVTERPEPLDGLYAEFAVPLEQAGYTFEFIFCIQQWQLGMAQPLRALAAAGAPVRILEFGQGVSETAMLKVGARNARAPIVVTMPAYRQTVAEALPPLVRRVEEGAELVVARRWPRRDSLVNRFQNRVLHMTLGKLAGGRLHDVACGVRAMRPKVLEETRVYGDFARFFPLVALRDGFLVDEVPVPVHPSATSPRVYGPGVYVRRAIDVLGLTFLLRFTDKPLRFFGLVGASLGMAGAVILLALLIERQFFDRGLADRPILLLGVLLVVLGVQAIALGLVGEMIVHLHAMRRPLYRLRERDTGTAASQRMGRPPVEAEDLVGAVETTPPVDLERAR
jgi:hypothetical protein